MSLAALLRALRPRRTIRPTRDGWWCLGAALGLGFAAMNTGNNLLYLMTALLLALIIVSGVLSERSRRGLRLSALVPDEIYAGRPVALGARLENRKRRRTSYSLALETTGQRLYVERLPAGEARLLTWETTLDPRGMPTFMGAAPSPEHPGLWFFGLDSSIYGNMHVHRRRLGRNAMKPGIDGV